MLQFLGGTNLLTGHTNEHWKAVRKAVAPSFSAGNMRSTPCIHPEHALRHVVSLQLPRACRPTFRLKDLCLL